MTYKHWELNLDGDYFPSTKVKVAEVAKMARDGLTYSEIKNLHQFLKTEDIKYSVIRERILEGKSSRNSTC